MKTIQITLHDTFSFTNEIKTVPYTEQMYNKLKNAFNNGGVIRHFDNKAQIAYNYKITQINLL